MHSNKNIVRLIESFHLATQRAASDALLVLAGRKFFGSDGIDETVQRLGLTGRVRMIGHQPQQHLPALYNGALGFVFPSLWEGFGLPVVEAMACGTPVVASNIACVPEIAGGAALLVNPLHTDDLADGIYRLLVDGELRTTLRDKGLARARHFSWENTALRMLAAYRRVAQA